MCVGYHVQIRTEHINLPSVSCDSLTLPGGAPFLAVQVCHTEALETDTFFSGLSIVGDFDFLTVFILAMS